MKEFPLFSNFFSVPEGLQFYNEINSKYINFSKEARTIFENTYNSYGNFDNLIQNGFNDGNEIILKYLGEVSSYFVSQKKIFDFPTNNFINEYIESDYYIWKQAFENIEEMNEEIVINRENINEHRTNRRLNRDKFVYEKTYFDKTSDQLGGKLSAGTMNLATNALHGGFNLLAAAGGMVRDSLKKSSIYNDEEVKNLLFSAMEASVDNIKYCFISKILDYNIITQEQFNEIPIFNSDMMAKHDAYIQNITMMGEDDLANLSVEIISSNPYEYEFYKTFIQKLRDKNNEIENIANYFCVDVQTLKGEIVSNYYNNLSFNTSKDSKLSRKKLQEFAREYSEKKVSELIVAEIDSKIKELENKERTVLGVVLNTQDEADYALSVINFLNNYKDKEIDFVVFNEKINKIENSEILEIMADNFINNYCKSLQLSTKQNYIDAKKQIIKISQCFKTNSNAGNMYIDAYSKKILQFENEEKTVWGVLLSSHEEADKTRSVIAYFDHMNYNNIDFNEVVRQSNQICNQNLYNALAKFVIKKYSDTIKTFNFSNKNDYIFVANNLKNFGNCFLKFQNNAYQDIEILLKRLDIMVVKDVENKLNAVATYINNGFNSQYVINQLNRIHGLEYKNKVYTNFLKNCLSSMITENKPKQGLYQLSSALVSIFQDYPYKEKFYNKFIDKIENRGIVNKLKTSLFGSFFKK